MFLIPERWKQDDREFKVILGYTENWKPSHAHEALSPNKK